MLLVCAYKMMEPCGDYKMFSKSLLILLTLLSFSNISWAGEESGWISSGGESFYDGKNPWFLKGDEVTYCLEMDESAFPFSYNEARTYIEESFQYWQVEFPKSGSMTLGPYRRSYKLGENSLKFSGTKKCIGHENLQFILGRNKLNDEQLNYLEENGHNYIGVAVRTNYDRKNLQGKGFIYVSSHEDLTSQAMSPDLYKTPWNHSRLLVLTLIHEIGHVFGIPHMGSSIMSEAFLDIITSKYYYRDFVRANIESFIAPPAVLDDCVILSPDMYRFFELDFRVVNCIVAKKISESQFDLFVNLNGSKEERIASLVSLESDAYGIESRPIGYLRLTSEQTRFTSSAINNRSLVGGPLIERYKMQGKIILHRSLTSRPVYMTISPEAITITSLLNDKFVTIYSYDSPYSYILGQSLDLTI